jgi:AraC-like DNA-binding protein
MCSVSSTANQQSESSSVSRAVIFDSGRFDPYDRADAMRGFFAPAMDLVFPSAVPGSAFGKLEVWQLGNIIVVSGQAVNVSISRNARQVSRDGPDHWILRVAHGGELLSRNGDRVYRQRAGDVSLDTMAEDLFASTEEGLTRHDWIVFVIPREGYEGLDLADCEDGLVKRPAVQLFADFAVSLVRCLRNAGLVETVDMSEITSSMIRSCFSLRRNRDEISRTDMTHLHRESVRTITRQNIGSPRLTPERLCEMTGLSRSALDRLFETHSGIGRFIQELRLGLVMQDLRDRGSAQLSISAIAEARGFHNASAFSRSFRRRFGCTPRDVRNAALLGAHLAAEDQRKTGRFGQLLG